jgi:hypothetical protein
MDLTPEAFDKLLARLDSDRDEAGRKYVDLLRKLARFLGYWGCSAPQDQADDALSRTAARILAGEPIENLQRYTLGVAHNVYKESVRHEIGYRNAMKPPEANTDRAEEERRALCYARCFRGLSSADKDLILKYYHGPKPPQPRAIGETKRYIIEFITRKRLPHPPKAGPLPGGLPQTTAHVTNNQPDDTLLTRYLLGELSQSECDRLEQDCLADDRLFEQLEAIEAELTDDYVRGTLRGQKRRQFEKRALQPHNLQLSQLITGCVPPHRSLPLRVLALAATLALAIGVTWFLLRHPSPKPAQPKVARNTQPIPPPPTPAPPKPAIATFVLTSGSIRGDAEANQIAIPAGATQVRFRLALPSREHQTYDASLTRVEGDRLFLQRNIKPRSANLLIDLPAHVLPEGTSLLTLTASGKMVAKYVITRKIAGSQR